MLSLQELSDRFEIQDLIYRYAELVDSKQFDGLKDIFTDAISHTDYSSLHLRQLSNHLTHIFLNTVTLKNHLW